MENPFGAIKHNSSSYRIQLAMIYQSYVFPNPMIFLFYESKEPSVGKIQCSGLFIQGKVIKRINKICRGFFLERQERGVRWALHGELVDILPPDLSGWSWCAVFGATRCRLTDNGSRRQIPLDKCARCCHGALVAAMPLQFELGARCPSFLEHRYS
jgi:hypothetical protein